MNALICQNERRRAAVRKQTRLYGLDYLQVGADQRTLTVYLLGKAPERLTPDNILIEGGRRSRDLRVIRVAPELFDDPELDDTLEVTVDRPGDFSTYRLRIVTRDAQGRPQPHPAFDPRYDSVEFSFKVDCPSELDCQLEARCPPVERAAPEINYLAKDYASFRQLILDRLALTLPAWRARHVPDIGIALVELLAYAGDYLSYYQDAVATEAYLETARQRISVRRHVRLVDYPMHEGCNARTWVTVKANGDPPPLEPTDTFFITRLTGVPAANRVELTQDDLNYIAADSYEVFEPLTDSPLRFYQAHNQISFYTWGDSECCLERGATAATLLGELVKDEPPPAHCPPEQPVDDAQKPPDYAQQSAQPTQPKNAPPKLHLRPGDVLLFEEVKGPKTGHEADANPAQRHVVRLTRVAAASDPLDDTPLVEIEWAAADALPFPLCLSALGPPPKCAMLHDVSVAHGNVVLVDHGRTIEEELDDVPVKTLVEECEGEGALADTSTVPGRYRPALKGAPLTFRQPAEENTPATRALEQAVHEALPQVWLTSAPAPANAPHWSAQRDLLGSAGDEPHFVAELDDEGRAHLRFGAGELGRSPAAGMKFHARYRIGNGTAGNIGAEAIAHIVTRQTKLSGGSAAVRNPLPAAGGTPPEPLAEVKLYAPHAFRRALQRAIIADDYAALVRRDFSAVVQHAMATLRWNGSWYEATVAVDQLGQAEAEQTLRDRIAKRLHRYRRIGHDVSVRPARLVPLQVGLKVCVQPHYLRGHVKAALLELFSHRVLPDGRKGFFHPDNLSFGAGVYLSQIVAAAQSVTGVESVQVTELQRLGEGERGELANGVLPLGPLEVAQLENDPNFPEHGKLTLLVEGGR